MKNDNVTLQNGSAVLANQYRAVVFTMPFVANREIRIGIGFSVQMSSKKEINRGWSDAGKIFRKVERFFSKISGIFCFSRPLYETNNITWDPEQIEYGIIGHETISCSRIP